MSHAIATVGVENNRSHIISAVTLLITCAVVTIIISACSFVAWPIAVVQMVATGMGYIGSIVFAYHGYCRSKKEMRENQNSCVPISTKNTEEYIHARVSINDCRYKILTNVFIAICSLGGVAVLFLGGWVSLPVGIGLIGAILLSSGIPIIYNMIVSRMHRNEAAKLYDELGNVETTASSFNKSEEMTAKVKKRWAISAIAWECVLSIGQCALVIFLAMFRIDFLNSISKIISFALEAIAHGILFISKAANFHNNTREKSVEMVEMNTDKECDQQI